MSKLKDTWIEIIQSEENKEKVIKKINKTSETTDTIKHKSTCIMGALDGKEKKGRNNVWRNNGQKREKFGEEI